MNFERFLVFLFLASFLFSLGYAYAVHIPLAVDAKAYDAIAWNLVEGNGYKENKDLSYADDNALGRAGPGYEFFIAGMYILFDRPAFWPVVILQSLFHVLSGVFILLIYRLLVSPPAGQKVDPSGWRAGLPVFLGLSLYLFHPDLIQINGMFLTEPLFIFLVTASVYLGLSLFKFSDQPLWKSVLFGGLLVYSALIRPVAFLIFGVFAVALFLKKYFKQAAIMFLMLLAIAGPWVLRNYVRNGILFTSGHGGLELWVSILPDSAGEFYMNQEVEQYREKNGLFKTAEHGMEEYKKFILQHPYRFILRQLEKASSYFSMLRTSAFWLYLTEFRFLRLVIIFSSAAFNMILFGLGLAGFYVFLREKKFINNIFLVLAASIPAAVIPIVVTGRYRYALLAFLAVGAIASLRFIFEKKRIPRFVYFVFAFLVLNCGLDAVWHFKNVVTHLKTLGL